MPLIGLCLGGQMVAAAAGAVPRRAMRPEIGRHPVEVTEAGREDPVLGRALCDRWLDVAAARS